jgi:mono/diheme cytochrome c family protein
MNMRPALVPLLLLVIVAPLVTMPALQAQTNGEAHATVPQVTRTDYDMAAFMAPLPLGEAELKGRQIFAQRCANCHGGTTERPGPPLGRASIQKLGDEAVRDKINKGSAMMPSFASSLQPAQIDEIMAFLKTFEPPRRQAPQPD